MANALHKDQGITQGIHIPYSWEYADSTARTGASGFGAEDVGKLARQTDVDSLWMLTATTPVWVQVGSGTSPAFEADALVLGVRKGSAGTIPKGQAVYISGYNVGGWIEVEAARSDSPSTMPALGLTQEAVTNAIDADVLFSGKLTGFDTSSWTVGTKLYVDPATAGALTSTIPIGPHAIQKIAQVTRSDATQGAVAVFGAGRANAVPNLAQDKVWLGDGSGVAQPTTLNFQAMLPDTLAALNAAISDATLGTLQNAYDLGSEVLTADASGPVKVRRGTTGGDDDSALEVRSNTNAVKLSVNGQGDLTHSGHLTQEVVVPTTLAADTHNYALGVGGVFRLTASVGVDLTGIVARANGTRIILTNGGTFNIALTDQDVLSTATNRIVTGEGRALQLRPEKSVELVYDNSRWRVLRLAGQLEESFFWDESTTPVFGNNVFTSWATLFAAVQFSAAAIKNIYCATDTFGTLTIPSGTHDPNGMTRFLFCPGISDITVAFASGAQFVVGSLVGLHSYINGPGGYELNSTTGPNILLGEDDTLVISGQTDIWNVAVSSTPGIRADGFAYVVLKDHVELQTNSGPVCGVEITAGFLTISVHDGCLIQADTLQDNNGDLDVEIYTDRLSYSVTQTDVSTSPVSGIYLPYNVPPHSNYIMGAADSAVNIPASPTWQTVPLSVVAVDDPNFGFAAGVATLSDGEGEGLYDVSFDVGFVNSATTNRTGVEARLALNGALVLGTLRPVYVRSATAGDIGGSASVSSILVALTVGDTLAIESTVIYGTGQIRVLGDAGLLSIRRVR